MGINKIVYKIKRKVGTVPYSAYETTDHSITYYDWWDCNPDMEWFTRFINNNISETKKYNFYSVFGNGTYIKKEKANKIFFTGENVKKRFASYRDYRLPYVDLALGFDEVQSEKYLRFPLWLTWMFEPTIDIHLIRNKIKEINESRNNKKYDCALISRHDRGHTREPIYNALSAFMDVRCAGPWHNNTRDLWDTYHDDKVAYLKNFKFNICPENTNSTGYVTEKLFESFLSGAIPVYYGSNNNPEPEILNQKAIIFEASLLCVGRKAIR